MQKMHMKRQLLKATSGRGEFEIVELLLNIGADVNAKDKKGSTALIESARWSKLELIKLLVENGAEINA